MPFSSQFTNIKADHLTKLPKNLRRNAIVQKHTSEYD